MYKCSIYLHMHMYTSAANDTYVQDKRVIRTELYGYLISRCQGYIRVIKVRLQ